MYKISSPIKRLSATLIDVVSFLLIVAIILLIAVFALHMMGHTYNVNDYIYEGLDLPTVGGVFGFLTDPIYISMFNIGYIMIDPPMSIVGGVLGAIVLSYLLYFIIVPAFGPNQTIGRVVTASKVVTEDGEEVGIGAMFIREFVGNLLLTIALIGVVINLIFVFGDKSKTISDVLSKSALVDIPEPSAKAKSSEENDDEDEDSDKKKKKVKEKKEKPEKEKKEKKKKGKDEAEKEAESEPKTDEEPLIG